MLQRIEEALLRGEEAAERLARRHVGLREVAQKTIVSLDRMIEIERQRANG